MGEIQVRKPNTEDFWKLLKIIKSGGKEAISRMKDLDSDNEMAAALLIVDVGMDHAEKDLKAFLADLAGMTVEEFNEGDFDLTFSVIEAFSEKVDLPSFFKRAADLFKKFKG